MQKWTQSCRSEVIITVRLRYVFTGVCLLTPRGYPNTWMGGTPVRSRLGGVPWPSPDEGFTPARSRWLGGGYPKVGDCLVLRRWMFLNFDSARTIFWKCPRRYTLLLPINHGHVTTRNDHTFSCPIICTDINSQCYFVHLTPQQCLVQQKSLANWAAIFGDNCWWWKTPGDQFCQFSNTTCLSS